ncbi:uncharacterized protein LOC134841203 [Symsagittifera roscoffensis]|uniref:uncharacterized protein LOC134841203 n=1 Tax=Symsagittifera roscoffensis TaxID=84072 RepID=UPI00307B62DF
MKLMTKSSSTKDALNNARNCIVDETKLTRSEAEKIQNKFTDMPEVCKMLRQLILLMKYMEKDRTDDPKQPICEFLRKISIEAMPGISGITLESCVFLWQALALQRTRLMLDHQDEEPYAGIQKQFKETLTSEQKKALDELPAKKKYVLLTYLNELIVLNLDEPDLMNPNYHIVEDGLAPAYFDDDLHKLNLPQWCKLKYAEDIIKHLIQTEG